MQLVTLWEWLIFALMSHCDNGSFSHIPTYTHIHIHTHSHVRTYARTHVCTYARTHVRTYARTHARTHTHTCVRAGVRACGRVGAHACIVTIMFIIVASTNVKVLTVMSPVTLLCVLVGIATGHPYSSRRKAGLYTQDIGRIAM